MTGHLVVASLVFSLGLASEARAGEGDGEGEAAGEGEATDCVPGCIDETTERLCSAGGAEIRLPCAADERCAVEACALDPALADSAGGCTCNDGGGDGSALGGVGVAGFVLPSWRRRRGPAINASSKR